MHVILLLEAGCGTLPNGHRWGEDATLLPELSRLGSAARRAALEPGTWLPAAGALLFTVDHFDRKVADWAASHNPVFGSTASAGEASDVLYGAQAGGAVLSVIVEPDGEEADLWLLSKAKGLAVEGGALLLTEGVTHGLKIATARTRPNGQSQSSFPSGHASSAFALATLTSRNLDSLALSDGARLGLQAGSYALAGTVAWARVEAHKHFPSDVLAGAALGHFFGAFIHDAFLELPEEVGLSFEFGPLEKEALVEISWPFG